MSPRGVLGLLKQMGIQLNSIERIQHMAIDIGFANMKVKFVDVPTVEVPLLRPLVRFHLRPRPVQCLSKGR